MATLQTGKATELITFSRTSNATVTDSDGLIKWAPHNLLLASEQFDAASWTKGAASVTANSIASPNGSTTADTLTEDSTTANHRLVYTVVTTNGRHTYSVFVKAGSRDWVYLRLSDSGAVARHAYFNVSTGAIGTVETNLSAQISSVGSGWYLCSVTVSDANAGSNPLVIGVTTADNINSHAGNGTGNIYLWGASLTRSDLGGMKANTSAYPMYNPTTPKNLLGFSEEFSSASWAKSNAVVGTNGVELITNGTFNTDINGWSNPTDGRSTASFVSGKIRITNDTAGNGYAYQTISTVIGKRYTVRWEPSAVGTLYATRAFLGTTEGTSAVAASTAAAVTGQQQLTFVATSTTAYFHVQVFTGSFGPTIQMDFDNISVQEVAAYVAPNGFQAARSIIPNTTSGQHYVNQVITVVNGTQHTSSLYVKAAGYSKVSLYDSAAGNRWASFSLSGAGSVLANGTSATGTISLVGDGWYRISMLEASGATAINYLIVVLDDAYTTANPISYAYSGNDISGIYVWGAQLSDSASLDGYVPNFGAAPTAAAYYGPRLDFDGSTLAAKGLLVEEARTNLALYSEEFGNAYWSKSSATVVDNAITAPSGLLVADSITTTSTGDGVSRSITGLTANGSYTLSFFVKSSTATFLRLVVYETSASTNRFSGWVNCATGEKGSATNGGTGSGSTLSVVPCGNAWYRVSLSGAVNNSATAMTVQVSTAAADSSTVGVSGVVYYLYGAQLEAGSFATSYIPTGAATATRSADVASVSTSQFPYSATEGTLVVNASVPFTTGSTKRFITLGDGTLNNRINLYPTSVGRNRAYVVSGGIAQADIDSLVDITAGVPQKSGFAFANNDFSYVVDAGSPAVDTSGVVPVASILNIGSESSGFHLNGHIRQITYIPRRISNTELQTRTV